MKTAEWFDSYLLGLATQAVPCLFYPAVAATGLPIKEVLFDADKQAAILVAIAERYPTGAVVRMSELWCEAAACGAPCSFGECDFPAITGTVADAEALGDFVFPDPVNDITLPMINALALAAPEAGKPIFAGATGPFTLGTVLAGSEDFLVAAISEPEAVTPFLDRATEFLGEYILRYKDAGAAGVLLAEPSIAMIAPDMAEELSNTFVRRIVDKVQDDDFAVIYHNCGDVAAHLGGIARLGARGYHFGDAFLLEAALAAMPRDALVFGNIHPVRFATLKEHTMEAAARDLRQRYSAHANFVPSSGCDLGPGVVESMLDAFFAGCE